MNVYSSISVTEGSTFLHKHSSCAVLNIGEMAREHRRHCRGTSPGLNVNIGDVQIAIGRGLLEAVAGREGGVAERRKGLLLEEVCVLHFHVGDFC